MRMGAGMEAEARVALQADRGAEMRGGGQAGRRVEADEGAGGIPSSEQLGSTQPGSTHLGSTQLGSRGACFHSFEDHARRRAVELQTQLVEAERRVHELGGRLAGGGADTQYAEAVGQVASLRVDLQAVWDKIRLVAAASGEQPNAPSSHATILPAAALPPTTQPSATIIPAAATLLPTRA